MSPSSGYTENGGETVQLNTSNELHNDHSNKEYVEMILLPLRRRLSEVVSTSNTSPSNLTNSKLPQQLIILPGPSGCKHHYDEQCKENSCRLIGNIDQCTDTTGITDNHVASIMASRRASMNSLQLRPVPDSDITQQKDLSSTIPVSSDNLHAKTHGTPDAIHTNTFMKQLKSCLSSSSNKRKRIRSPLQTPTYLLIHDQQQVQVNSTEKRNTLSSSPSNTEPIRKKQRLDEAEQFDGSHMPRKIVQFAPSSAVEYEQEEPVNKSLTPIPPETATKRYPIEMKPLSFEELENIRITKENHAILNAVDNNFYSAAADDGKGDDSHQDYLTTILVQNHCRRMKERRRKKEQRQQQRFAKNRRRSFYMPSSSWKNVINKDDNSDDDHNSNDNDNIHLHTI